jgi:hypothetical protein
MDMGQKEPKGSLDSFDGKSITKLVSDITISNDMPSDPEGNLWAACSAPDYYRGDANIRV